MNNIFLEQQQLRFDSVTEKFPTGFTKPVQIYIGRALVIAASQEVKKGR